MLFIINIDIIINVNVIMVGAAVSKLSPIVCQGSPRCRRCTLGSMLVGEAGGQKLSCLCCPWSWLLFWVRPLLHRRGRVWLF